MLHGAVVAEHQQSMQMIITSLPHSATGQTAAFIAPDRFLWHVETPAGWEEVVSIAGVVSSRSSVQDWTQVDLLSPLAAAAMKQFIDPPAPQGTAEELLNLVAAAGVADPGLESHMTGPTTEEGYQPLWLCELTFKSGESVIARERTWVGAADGLRHNFEHEEGGGVTEMRSFLYSDFIIEGPSS